MTNQNQVTEFLEEKEKREKVVQDFLKDVLDGNLDKIFKNALVHSGNYLVDIDRNYKGYIGFLSTKDGMFSFDTRSQHIIFYNKNVYIKELLYVDERHAIFDFFKDKFYRVQEGW